MEETGLKASKLEFMGKTERDSIEYRCHLIYHHFHVNEFEGNVILSEDHDASKWLIKEEILKMKSGKEIGVDTLAFFKLKP